MDEDTNNYEIENNNDYTTPLGQEPEDLNSTPTPNIEFVESLDSPLIPDVTATGESEMMSDDPTPTPNSEFADTVEDTPKPVGTGEVDLIFPDDPTPTPFLNTPTSTFDGALLTPTPNTGFADTEEDTPKPVGTGEVDLIFPDDPTPTPFLNTPTSTFDGALLTPTPNTGFADTEDTPKPVGTGEVDLIFPDDPTPTPFLKTQTPLPTPTSNNGFADTDDDTPNPLGTGEADYVSEDDPTPTPFKTPTSSFDGALLTPTPTSGDFASSDNTPTPEFLGTGQVEVVSADDPTPTPFLKTPTSTFDGALLTPTPNSGFADDDSDSTPTPSSTILFFALVDSQDGGEFEFSYYETPTPTVENFAPIEDTPLMIEKQPTPNPIGDFADDVTTPSSLNLNEGTINDMDSNDLDYSTPTPANGFIDIPDMGDPQALTTPTPVNGFADDVFDSDQIDIPDMGDVVLTETPTPGNVFADDEDVFDPDQVDVPDMEDMPNVVFPTPYSDEGFTDEGENFFDSDMGEDNIDYYDSTPVSDGFVSGDNDDIDIPVMDDYSTPTPVGFADGNDIDIPVMDGYSTPTPVGFADGNDIDIPVMDGYSTPTPAGFADGVVDPTPTTIFYDLPSSDYVTPSSAGFADGDGTDDSDIDIPNMGQATPTPQNGFADDPIYPTPTSYVDPAQSEDLPTPSSQDGFTDDGIDVTPSSYVDPISTPTFQDGFVDDTMQTPTSADGFADSMNTPTMDIVSANAPMPGLFLNETTPTSEEGGFSDDGEYSPTSLFADDGGLSETNPTPTSYTDVAFAPVPGGFMEDDDTSYPTPTSDSGFSDSSDDISEDVIEDGSDPMANTTPSSTFGDGFMDGFETQTPIPMDVDLDYTEGSGNTEYGTTPTSTSEDTFADDDGSNSWVEEMYAGEDATPTSSVECPSDVRTCPDGTVINRSPLAGCEFIPCGFNNNEFIDNHILWSKSEPSHYTYNMRWTGQLASNEAYLTEERKVTVVNGRMTKAETVSTGEFFVDVNTNEDLAIPYLSLLEWFFWAGGQIERNPYVLNFEFDPKGFIKSVFCDETMGQADEFGFIVSNYVELDPIEDDDNFADGGSTTPTPNVNDGLLDNPPSTPEATSDSDSASQTPTPLY